MIRFFILSLFYLFNARAFCAPKSLAVLAFHNINIDADLLLDAEQQIRTQLMDHLDPQLVQVIPGNKTLPILINKKQPTSCFDSQCALAAARILDAQYVLFGVISKSDSAYIVSFRLHRNGEVEPLSTRKEQIVADDSAAQTLASLAHQVLTAANVADLAAKKMLDQEKSTGRFSSMEKEWSMKKHDSIVVQFNSEPTGSRVELDGRLLCSSTPCQKMIPQGKHQIVMKKTRYQSWQSTIEATDGLKVVGKLNPYFGYLQIISEVAGVHLSLDGESLGITPLPVIEVDVGKHKIEVDDTCYTGPSYTFQASKNITEQVNYPVMKRQAGVRVSLSDASANELIGKVYVDDVYVGNTPGSYQVALCSKKLVVKYEGRELLRDLSLVEKKITKVDLRSQYQATLQTDGYEVVLIPSGRFTMGCTSKQGEECADSEKPVHQVTISRSFYMMKSEVTQQLYKKVLATNPSRFRGLKRPVDKVSWYDAVRFANSLSALEGREKCYKISGTVKTKVVWSNTDCRGWRLPTEAEWEYAARGGQGARYAGSNKITEVAWYDGNSVGGTHEVCKKKRNRYGLCDMSGNVFEWVWDSWRDNYGVSLPVTDPIYVNLSSPYRVLRGGDWNNASANALISFRDGDYPSVRLNNQGFRLVRGL